MEIGFSGRAFSNLFAICIVIALTVIMFTLMILHKKGVDITKNKVGLSVTLSCIFVFLIIPFWLTDLSILDKFLGSMLAIIVAIGNYFAVGRIQRILKEQKDKNNKL